jgi:hypothetical protein
MRSVGVREGCIGQSGVGVALDADRPCLLVLVLAARARPYPALVRTIKQTWASTRVAGMDTLFFFGGHELRLRGQELTLPVPDDLAHVGHKTLACFDYGLSVYAPTVVFRTNCSSYVDLPNLSAFVRDRVCAKRFYGGKISVHEGIRFASGSGYFLSRDLVELVLAHRDAWDHTLPDDVALAALLRRHGFTPEEVTRQDVTGYTGVNALDFSQFHFRCKSPVAGSRDDDRLVMLALHRAFCRSRGASATTRARIQARIVLTRVERSLSWRMRQRFPTSPLTRWLCR